MVFKQLLPAAFGLVCATMATPAHAATETMDPTSAWTVDYADEKCSLLRDFGDVEKDGIGLRIDSYGSLVDFRVNVIGKKLPKARKPMSLTEVELPPDELPRTEVQALHGRIGNLNFIQFDLAFKASEPAKGRQRPSGDLAPEDTAEMAAPRTIDASFEAGVDSIKIAVQPGRSVDLRTGPIAPALAAIRTCVDDLRKSWGLDPEKQKSLTRRAHPIAASVENVKKDFPEVLAALGRNAIVPLRVMVDAEGNGTGCTVQISSAPEEFRKAACTNIGTSFVPALDKSGRPIPSFYQANVIYMSDRL